MGAMIPARYCYASTRVDELPWEWCVTALCDGWPAGTPLETARISFICWELIRNDKRTHRAARRVPREGRPLPGVVSWAAARFLLCCCPLLYS